MATPNITLTDLYTKVRAFIRDQIGDVEVVQGLGNEVPTPPGAFVCMTAVFQGRLSTNISTYIDEYPLPDPVQEKRIELKQRVDLQLDFYGPDSQAWATTIEALWRDEKGCEGLAPTCQPLYADEARMIPLITGEEQYLERWSLTGTLQYNPIIALPQEFAGTLEVDLIDVDERYPP